MKEKRHARKDSSVQSPRHRLSFFLSVAQCISAWAASPKQTVLYSFQGTPDGFSPSGRLAMDKAGNLYGTTWFGGTGAPTCEFGTCGTVFQLTPPATSGGAWTESVIYNFQGYTLDDGSTPTGGVIWGKGDKLYGVTAYGGGGACTLLGGHAGCGTVYELTPPATTGGAWTETVIYSFQGGSDGYFAVGELVADKEGNLYGSTYFGGGYGTCDYGIYPYCGTVFELSPPTVEGGAWTQRVLYSFKSGTDGAQPNGGLVLDTDGAIYGTTFDGGNTGCNIGYPVGCGTIFKLIPPPTCQNEGVWREQVLYRFPLDGLHGATPWGGMVFDENGNLYGTTEYGGWTQPTPGGTVFRLSRSAAKDHWILRTLFSFQFGSFSKTGGLPTATVILDARGNIYGTTSSFGPFDAGTIFRLKSPSVLNDRWQFDVLHSFEGTPDGAAPRSQLVIGAGGHLYGSAYSGGDGTNCYPLTTCGVVYEIAP